MSISGTLEWVLVPSGLVLVASPQLGVVVIWVPFHSLWAAELQHSVDNKIRGSRSTVEVVVEVHVGEMLNDCQFSSCMVCYGMMHDLPGGE